MPPAHDATHQGDHDGNASTDLAVFGPSTGAWYAQTGLTTTWGTSGDQPLELPAAVRQALFG